MRLILRSIFFIIILFFMGNHQIFAQKFDVSDSLYLVELKNKGKDYLYKNTDSALYYFQKLDSESSKFYKNKKINLKSSKSFKADANTGYGNYYLIGKGIMDSTFYYYDIAIELYREIEHYTGIGSIFNNKGLVLERSSKRELSLASYDSALYYYKIVGNEKSTAKTYGNIGNVYIDLGNFPVAKENFIKCITLAEKLSDSALISYCYFDFGTLSKYTKDFEEAKKNYLLALHYCENLNDTYGVASAYFSLANLDKQFGELDSAYFKYYKALQYYKDAGIFTSESQCHINLGYLYSSYYDSITNFSESFKPAKAFKVIENIKNSGLDSAFFHLLKAVELSKLTSNKFNLIYAYNGLSIAYLLNKQPQKALEIINLARIEVEDGNFKNEYQQLANNYYRIYKSNQDYKNALYWYETYISKRDSIFNDENTKSIMQQQFQYEYDKKTTADSLIQAEAVKVKNAEIAAEKAESDKLKIQKLYMFFGLGILFVFGIFMYNRFKVTQKQKKIIQDQKNAVESQKDLIEMQHHQLEETHKEITDSIQYAKRIQAAILPPDKMVKSYLPNSFILYKPKDIVAGDFYWLEHKDNKVLFAAADCTGHGVPGAMVSVVCNNGLNRSVREYGLTSPNEILNKTREIVINEFEKSEEEVKDGMDISLCSLDISKLELEWAGANNPLWIIRNNEIIEYKADKQPIGKYANAQPFTNHIIQLQKDDLLYIFTDGFVDQFGGEKSKKFLSANFKKLLLSVQDLPLMEQKEKIDTAFENWKTKEEQVDDVCIIGVKI